MKIAIQGHLTRGKEVIQILESLGGKNTDGLEGTYDTFYYIDDKNEIGDDYKKNFPPTYELYTLEEFEKEFPFKIGDKVIALSDNKPYKIIVLEHYNGKLCYKLDNGFHYQPRALKPYKEMKEERNITLTLDKAKEWYKKGGELREIALQAYSEEELTKVKLPKTWEEFCINYPIKKGECWVGATDSINICSCNQNTRIYKNWTPSQKSAEAHLAMIQLEQLRNCWWGDWEPDWCDNIAKYAIKKRIDKSTIERIYVTHAFLSFPTYELALEFRECFRDLIEQARDLI